MFVCCLSNQNFHAGLVGRKFFFCSLSQKKTLFLGKIGINRSKKKNCFSKMAKKINEGSGWCLLTTD